LSRYFFDSSALAKRYHPEIGTAKIMSIFAEPDCEVRISRLTFVELQSVFAMKVRSGFINRTEAGQQRARLVVDVAEGGIEEYGVTPEHFAAAEALIVTHGFSARLRTLDAIQLAVALDLSKQNLVDHFVVSDKALAEVAVREGLSVLDPETA
jgi:predicted nucleic acid-binding protein